MKLYSYDEFCKKRAEELKKLRKSIGITRNMAGEILFNKDYHVIDNIEYAKVKTAYRSEYITYIYENILEMAELYDKDPSFLFEKITDYIMG